MLESETNFSGEPVKVCGKVLKENFSPGTTRSSEELFILKSDTAIVDEDVSLTGENL